MNVWNRFRIGVKLGFGFIVILLLLVFVGWSGYNGINIVYENLKKMGDEAAPVVDIANEMKLTLNQSRNIMREYRLYSSAIATSDSSRLEPIVLNYQQSIQEFDTYVENVLNGVALPDGTQLPPAQDPALIELLNQTTAKHRDNFQPAAQEMIDKGNQLLAQAEIRNQAMSQMESVFVTVTETASQLENLLKGQVASVLLYGATGEALSLFNAEIKHIDMALQMALSISQSRTKMEEFVQRTSLDDLDELANEYQQSVDHFMLFAGAVINGGETPKGIVEPTSNTGITVQVQQLIQQHIDEFQPACSNLMNAHRTMITASQNSEAAMRKLDAAGLEMVQQLNQFEQAVNDQMNLAKSIGNQASQTAEQQIGIVSIFSVLIGVILGYSLTNNIVKPLKQSVLMAEQIGNGNLNHQVLIQSKDEVGQLAASLNHMRLQLNHVISNIIQSSNQVAGSSQELSNTAQIIAENANQQAASLEQTSAAVEELSASINENAAGAQNAEAFVSNAKNI